MQENAVGILGSLEHLARDLVGGEQLYALGDLVLFAHGGPDVGVERVRALDEFSVLAVLDDAPVSLPTSRQYSTTSAAARAPSDPSRHSGCRAWRRCT